MTTDFTERFAARLKAQEASPKTVADYVIDLRKFTVWFRDTNGQELTLDEITPGARLALHDHALLLDAYRRGRPAHPAGGDFHR